MKRFIKIFSTPAARSSAIFYFGSFLNNFGKYLFHLILLRLLLPAEYGEFLAYLSLLYLLSIPNGTIANLVIKHVSEYQGKGETAKINQLFYHLLKKLYPITVTIALALVIFSGTLANILKAYQGAFIILGLFTLISLISTITGSYLIAFQRFISQVLVGSVETVLMIFLALVFIKLQFSATGAVAALLLAVTVGTLLLLYLIRDSIFPRGKDKTVKFSLRTFGGYSFIYAIGSLSLISTDVLLVRYFFSEQLSGIYSSLSILGRMIYFGLGPLITLILPIASHRYAAAKTSKSVLLKLGGVIVLFGLIAASVFSLFPSLVVTILSGPNYIEAAKYLPVFAFSMLFFSLNLFLVSYFMAIGKPKVNLYLLAITIVQPLVILAFHQSLSQIVWSNLLLETSLLILLLWQIKKVGI